MDWTTKANRLSSPVVGRFAAVSPQRPVPTDVVLQEPAELALLSAGQVPAADLMPSAYTPGLLPLYERVGGPATTPRSSPPRTSLGMECRILEARLPPSHASSRMSLVLRERELFQLGFVSDLPAGSGR